MKISLEGQSTGYVIQGYTQAEIRVRGPALSEGGRELVVHKRGVVVSPENVIADWGPDKPEDLDRAHLEALAALRPEVVLLGLGARPRALPASLVQALVELKIAFEAMDTGAACRTYNILAAEGRRVAAALLIG